MVVFTCAHCGDSLQKPKVEKHYDTKCRNKIPDLCCVDCLEDFRGDEFFAHTKCVSEAERYGGKGYAPKPGRNKGERKQTAWLEIVQSAIDDDDGARPSVKLLLEKVSKQPNTPRKESKFYNFVKSLDRRFAQDDVRQAWGLLEAKLNLVRTSEESRPATDGATISEDEDGHTKRKNSEDTDAVSKKEKTKKNKVDPVRPETEERQEANGASENETERTEAPSTEDRPLGKKERKEKKKRAKYEARLEEIRSKTSAESVDESESKKERKKRARDAVEENEPAAKKSKEDFDWIGTVTKALAAKGNEMRLKKLQKRVLTEYCIETEAAEASERAVKKFTKTLKNLENVRLEGERVIMS